MCFVPSLFKDVYCLPTCGTFQLLPFHYLVGALGGSDLLWMSDCFIVPVVFKVISGNSFCHVKINHLKTKLLSG